MTANLSFQIEKHAGVLTIPNAALRFHPKPEQVRPRDRAIVEGKSDDDEAGGRRRREAAATAGDRRQSATASGITFGSSRTACSRPSKSSPA